MAASGDLGSTMKQSLWIKILNWDKHNPRKDIKEPKWFAFSNRLIEDEDLFDFTHGEFKALIYLFSKASQKKSSVIRVSPVHAEKVCNISPEDMASAIKKLKSSDLKIIVDPTPEEIEKAITGDSDHNPNVSRTPPVHDPNATEEDRGGQGTTGEDRTEHVDPPAVGGILPELQDELLDQHLVHVSVEVQRSWLHEFPDSTWVKKALRKCFSKRKSKRLSTPTSKIASICTDWLYKEDNPPPRYKPPAPQPELPPDPRGQKRVEDLLNDHALKSLNKIRAGGMSHAG